MADLEELAQSWLSVQCRMIAGAKRAVVALLSDDQNTCVIAASWPASAAPATDLAEIAGSAVAKRNAVIHSLGKSGGGSLAYPIVADKRLLGAVAVEMPRASESQQQTALRLLQWGVAWFQFLLRERGLASRERLATILELLASCLEHPGYEDTAAALATELCTRLHCDRVSLGYRRGANSIRLLAISHSSRFDRRGAATQLLESAMEEAFDQRASVVFPPLEGRIQVALAHEKLAKQEAVASICTVTMKDGDEVNGVILLERGGSSHFSSEELQLCERTADLVGPLLELKRRAARSAFARFFDSLRLDGGGAARGGHWGIKLGVVTAGALLIAVSQIEADFRIKARASLVGEIQRVIAAPQDGYIAEAPARAGDVVLASDIVAVFDDRDLRLERLKVASEKERLVKEQRGALAKHDRTEIAVIGARIAQAEAQLELLDSQLERVRVLAPLGGVVVSGDLSQKLGSPVRKGDVLFEVAPLDSYRVVLQVDERDVSYVAQGHEGQLALSALPGQVMDFTVTKLTPVSVSLDGANVFRVEAQLHETIANLRPGMEGVGKIAIERRPLLWIWTRRLVDQLRLWTWSWWP